MSRGLLLTLLVGVMIFPARANIAPPTTLYIHAQPFDPDYCSYPNVTNCESVVQTTEAAGDVLFAVFMSSQWGYNRITSLDFSMQWNPNWYLYGLDQCAGAQITYDYWYDNTITIHLAWPDCPMIPYWQPVCVLGMGVYNDGCISIDSGGEIRWGCPSQYTWTESPVGGRAEAGVQCAYSCLLDCSPWEYTCVPQLAPETLHFELAPGQIGRQLMHLVVSAGWPHDVGFDATEPWAAFATTNVQNHEADVEVVVDATGLAPGDYSATMHATCDGRDCSTLTLTVIDNSQSIPDEEPGSATPTTWGGVKNLYRYPPR